MRECERFNLPTHEPAPTCHLGIDYANFDGDVVTCHTVKYGAVAACSVELSSRVMSSSIANPGKVQLAYDVVPNNALYKAVEWSPLEYEYPNTSSGLFALWWALNAKYDEIYLCGIDGYRIIFKHGKYDYKKACEYVRKRERGFFVSDIINEPTEVSAVDEQMINAIEHLKRRFPSQKIYKVGSLSQAPVPVKAPPMRVNPSSQEKKR